MMNQGGGRCMVQQCGGHGCMMQWLEVGEVWLHGAGRTHQYCVYRDSLQCGAWGVFGPHLLKLDSQDINYSIRA